MKSRVLGIALVIVALGLALPWASAQDESQASVQDQTTAGVARISVIRGDVTMQRGDAGEWVATTVNTPLVRGDKIATGPRSRAEIQLDYANVLRLDQNTEVTIADLTRDRIQLQVATGLADVAVFKDSQAELEADTPNMAVRPQGAGTYRIQVDSPSETSMTVRQGQAVVSTPQGSTTVEQGQVIYVKGTDNPEYRTASAAGLDEWDQWNRERDNAILDAKSWNHTNQYYTGTQDLDQNGRWVNVPNYDWCWTPYVNAGWVPYRDGSWIWEPYWGWTWVSYEPWGWAPYHYGRWFWYGSSWYWWPGYSYWGYYPTWAPAYVSFLGFGFGGRHWGFGFGFGFNSIGWCPLGPYDRIRPWWGHGNRFNVVNITNINNYGGYGGRGGRGFGHGPGHHYVSNLQAAMTNANVRRGITTVPTSQFVTGRVGRHMGTISPAVLRTADVIHGTLPAVPTRQALRPVDRPARVPSVAQRTGGERFFTRNPVRSTPQVSFNQRAGEIQQMMRTHNTAMVRNNAAGQQRSFANAAGQQGPANASRALGANTRETARVAAPQVARSGQPAGNAGWRRFGNQPAPGSAQRANSPRAAQAQSGEGRSERVQGRAAPATGQSGQRFGQQGTRERWPAAVNMQGGRSSGQNAQSRSAAPNQGNWRRFNSQPAPSSPGRSQGNAAPRSSAPVRGGESAGFRRFTPQAAPTARGGATRSQQAQPGWNRFQPGGARSSQPSGRWNAPAPRSQPGGTRGYQRRPLELNKPIVRERSYTPRGYSGGGGRWSAPGPSRGYSAPRGGGRSYSAPRGGGGGGRSYSAPRGGRGGGWGGGHASSHGGGGGHRR